MFEEDIFVQIGFNKTIKFSLFNGAKPFTIIYKSCFFSHTVDVRNPLNPDLNETLVNTEIFTILYQVVNSRGFLNHQPFKRPEKNGVLPTGVSSVSIVYGHLPELRPVDPEKDRFVSGWMSWDDAMGVVEK